MEGFVGLEERFSNSDLSLSGTHDTTSEEDEVFIDNTIVGESSDGSDVLGIRISFGGSVVLNVS